MGADPVEPLDWQFLQCFGERTPGEEIQEGRLREFKTHALFGTVNCLLRCRTPLYAAIGPYEGLRLDQHNLLSSSTCEFRAAAECKRDTITYSSALVCTSGYAI